MSQFNEGSNITFRAFVPIPGTATALVAADVDLAEGIDLAVFNGVTQVYGLAGIAAGSIIVTLTQYGWTKDARGYNFEYTVAGGAFEVNGGVTYRIEFTIHTVNHGPIKVYDDTTCVGMRST